MTASLKFWPLIRIHKKKFGLNPKEENDIHNS